MPTGPFRLCDPPLRHSHGDIKSILRTSDGGQVLAGDIKRRSVGRGGDGDGQTPLDGDAAVKGEELHGDLALVVVHGHDAVVVLPLEEDGIAGPGPIDVDPPFPCRRDGRPDARDFLGPKRPVFAIVGVQRTYGEAGCLNTGFPSIIRERKKEEGMMSACSIF